MLLKIQDMMDINKAFLQWSINTSRATVINENISNKELEEESQKPIIIRFNKRKVHSPFIDNVWGADVAVIQLISTFNKGFRYLLRVIVIYSKYAWIIPLKDKKGITIIKTFSKILDESNGKLSKILVDKGSGLYNRSMKSLLQNNDVKMYSLNNEGKSIVAGGFIRASKNKFYKYGMSISKNVYIDILGDIVNK